MLETPIKSHFDEMGLACQPTSCIQRLVLVPEVIAMESLDISLEKLLQQERDITVET